MGVHMAAQRLHLTGEGLHLAAQGAVYGSYGPDMQYMLHLAGPAWGPRREGRRQVEASQGALGPLTDSWR